MNKNYFVSCAFGTLKLAHSLLVIQTATSWVNCKLIFLYFNFLLWLDVQWNSKNFYVST